MSDPAKALLAHLQGGVTHTCRAWALSRRDGVVFGFTDHDRALVFEGITFKPDTGLSALAVQQTTGLSVDNTEALGALSDAAIREDDIEAGRFDGAEIRAWLVNWQAPEERLLQFRGTIGEIRRTDGAFEAELRGLTEALNHPLGRTYQTACTAVLGDAACGFDLDTAGYSATLEAGVVAERRVFRFAPAVLEDFELHWFERGRLLVRDGPAAGLSGMIKRDWHDAEAGNRVIELWAPLRAPVAAGDMLRLEAGCDKRMETCRFKFDNLLNFQGFPDIPGDDWTITDPSKAGRLSGGSRR
ncbi:DUF2163 domain-containing protein [Roseovarius salinarum]|uniref:DUF2163 domain-containing protein n=1 Tax=Roseovarius salinarum TaxID=1981892 RepID=UPI000C34E1B7|nr:DUF2163 domain-containing protein [Roseovarius salinarum]